MSRRPSPHSLSLRPPTCLLLVRTDISRVRVSRSGSEKCRMRVQGTGNRLVSHLHQRYLSPRSSQARGQVTRGLPLLPTVFDVDGRRHKVAGGQKSQGVGAPRVHFTGARGSNLKESYALSGILRAQRSAVSYPCACLFVSGTHVGVRAWLTGADSRMGPLDALAQQAHGTLSSWRPQWE
jgi:hypothetical protein